MTDKEFFERLDAIRAIADSILDNEKDINFRDCNFFINVSVGVEWIHRFFDTYDEKDFTIDANGNIVRRK